MKSSGLVWLASYPKSGNTWFRILLANLRSRSDSPVDINADIEGGSSVISRLAFDQITMLASGLLRADEVERLRPAVCEALAAEAAPCRWEKVHYHWSHTPSGEPLLGRTSARAAVYLVRDPRDVAVSYAHHQARTIDKSIDLLNSGDARLCISHNRQHPELEARLGDWSGHVASWLDQTELPVHVTKYEDLRENTAQELESAVRFAGEPAAAKDIARAVRFSQFGELKRQEETSGFRERSPAGVSPFFRRGQVGSWRDELSPGQAARIVAIHGEMMDRLGYLP